MVHTNTSYKCVIASFYHDFLWMCYHMATWTMQYHKRTENKTLRCPPKDKPFGFKKSLALRNFICFLLFDVHVGLTHAF